MPETLPILAEGETYVATLIDAIAQTGYHLILLPGDADDADFETQIAWAKSQGGDLPTRVEQALLWEKQRDQFKKDWYWSNEKYDGDASYAWNQYFNYGTQSSLHITLQFRARAVRRSVIS